MKKFLIFIVILGSSFVAACNHNLGYLSYKNDLNAEIIEKEEFDFREEFLEENKKYAKPIFSYNPETGESGYTGELAVDSPVERCVIVSDIDYLKKICETSVNVDFVNKILVIYFFTNHGAYNKLVIKNATISDGIIDIKFNEQLYPKPEYNPGGKFYQDVLIFTIDKVSYNSINIERI